MQFSLSLGSNFHGTAGAWANAVTSLGTSNQTNFMSSTSNNFYLAGCQLEIGDTASDFEHLPRDITENRCLRYYYRQQSMLKYMEVLVIVTLRVIPAFHLLIFMMRLYLA